MSNDDEIESLDSDISEKDEKNKDIEEIKDSNVIISADEQSNVPLSGEKEQENGLGSLVDEEFFELRKLKSKKESFTVPDSSETYEEINEDWSFTDIGQRRKELAKLAKDRINKLWWERAADGNLYLARKLFNIANGCAVEWRNENVHNRTAVMEAAFRGQTSTCRWLIKKLEARQDVVDAEGKTPLILAACGGQPDVCALLITIGGANLEAKDTSGWTALMWSVALDHYDCMQVLLDHGADCSEIGLPYPGSSTFNAGLSLLPLSAGIYKIKARAEGERRRRGERMRIQREVEARRRKWEADKLAEEQKEREDQEKYRMDIWRRMLTRR